MHTFVYRYIFTGHRMPMQQVPTVVFVNGKPIHHGVVERAYEKLRAIIQLYVLHKQEARRILWPSVVSSSSIEQPKSAYAHDTHHSPSHVYVSLRRSSLAMHHQWSANYGTKSYSTSSSTTRPRFAGPRVLLCSAICIACILHVIYTTGRHVGAYITRLVCYSH